MSNLLMQPEMDELQYVCMIVQVKALSRFLSLKIYCNLSTLSLDHRYFVVVDLPVEFDRRCDTLAANAYHSPRSGLHMMP